MSGGLQVILTAGDNSSVLPFKTMRVIQTVQEQLSFYFWANFTGVVKALGL